ncbi:MAG: hypothetical protein M3Z36_03495 [Acidobacteriota bacterium]|nr:hypothetical protein [Acidobacteriota bacterium]
MRETKLIATLRKLDDSEIEFIVVGGLAAVLNGAPIQTYDLERGVLTRTGKRRSRFQPKGTYKLTQNPYEPGSRVIYSHINEGSRFGLAW